jgi:LysR family transcriptional regulator, regulator for bpeEF and oprC
MVDMVDMSGLRAFVNTAEQKSFRKAAAKLEVSAAAVSKAVAQLERRLGVKLLDRTSRHVALTREGAVYLEHAQRALQELQAGQDRISHALRSPEGVLRVSMSPILGPFITRHLSRVTASHPKLMLDLRLSDRKANLIQEELDIVIRIGVAEDSGLIARKLRTPQWRIVGSPTYLARRGVPLHTTDLSHHACWKFTSPQGGVVEWALKGEGGSPLPTQHRADSGDVLIAAATHGLGLVQAFDFHVEHLLVSGALQEVLPGCSGQAPPLHVMCRPGRQKAPAVRVFMDFLADIYGPP